MCNVERAVAVGVPPFQFDNLFKAQIRDQIENVMRHHQRGCGSGLAAGLARNGAQRLAVQVVEVRVGYQHHIGRRQVAQVQSRLPQTLEHEKPAREVGIDDDILPADL